MCGVSAVVVTILPVNGPKLNPGSPTGRGAPKGDTNEEGNPSYAPRRSWAGERTEEYWLVDRGW